MTMAARITPGTHAPCTSRAHRHDVPPTGGRCAFYSPGRPGNICGRTPVAVYVNPNAKVTNTYHCVVHDRDIVVVEAARQGFRRVALDG